MIAVLDANLLIRSAFRRDLDSDNLLARAQRGEFMVATSPLLLAELHDVFISSRLSGRFRWHPGEAERYIATLRSIALVVEPAVVLNIVRDPPDNRVLEAAVASEADYIVSTDGDLLDLRVYEGVQIVTQAELIAILRTAQL